MEHDNSDRLIERLADEHWNNGVFTPMIPDGWATVFCKQAVQQIEQCSVDMDNVLSSDVDEVLRNWGADEDSAVENLTVLYHTLRQLQAVIREAQKRYNQAQQRGEI